MQVFKLTKKQQAAFNALKKAANKCNLYNIGFINVYGTIHAFNKDFILRFGVDCNYEINCADYAYPPNYIENLGGDSYADDQNAHSFKLTDKGKKIFSKDVLF